MYKIGIDLGGTKIEGAVLDAENRVLFRERFDTGQEKGYEGILANLKHVYDTMCSRIQDAPHTLGLGTPGSISRATGLLKNSNTVCLNERLTQKELVNLFGRDLTIQNDANCFALAEALLGAGRGARLVFGVIMGTGCGGGIVLNGNLWEGFHSIAGEWGHVSMDPEGPECYCGTRGCVETFISGGGLERLYKKQFHETRTLPDIVTAYRKGAKREGAFIRLFFERFARALANLINVLDPDVVVLGGGLSNIEELYTQGAEKVRRLVFNDSCQTAIVKNQLGDSAGVLGAALIGSVQLQSPA